MSPDTQRRPSNSRRAPAQKIGGRRIARSPPRRRLRCPFHAKFPEKPRGSSSSCHGTGFKTCARLVEHLKRAHGPLELNDEALTQAGAIDGDEERVTNEQLAAIAQLPRNPNADEKWDMIYKIIFPGDEASKPAYMPSAEQLRDYARDPPDWLLTNLIGAVGMSRQEIIIMMQHFLIFFDIVRGSPSSLPPSTDLPPLTKPGQSSTGSESLVETPFMDGSYGASEADFSLEVASNTWDFEFPDDIEAFCAVQDCKDTDMADI